MNRRRVIPSPLVIAAGTAASLGCAGPFDPLRRFDPQSCAENALRRSADPALLPESAELMTSGCLMSEADACSIAGVMNELGRGARMDVARAASLYERACALGNARGCANVGELSLRSGRDLRAPALLDRACRAGQGRACVVLGRAEIDGTLAPASLASRCRSR